MVGSMKLSTPSSSAHSTRAVDVEQVEHRARHARAVEVEVVDVDVGVLQVDVQAAVLGPDVEVAGDRHPVGADVEGVVAVDAAELVARVHRHVEVEEVGLEAHAAVVGEQADARVVELEAG
jgi:hypothetical protein